MTGRELIVYILENHLEDEPVFKDGAFVGFVPVGKAAEEMNVGLASMDVMINMYGADYICTEDGIYLPFNYKSQLPTINK